MEDDKPSNQVVSTDLGLNDHHQSILKSYIQFARYLRQQNLKSVELSFQDVIESRLLEATYTQSEVSQLLHNLKQLVTLDIENELINVSHINCLLLKQLFTQAEKWYLYLNIDISEIQNKHLLEVVKSLDTASSNPNEPSPTLAEIKTHKLQPLEQIHIEKISTILKSEIEKLKAANEMFVTQNEELKEENGKLKQQREMLNRMMDEKDKEMDKVVKERMSEDKVNTDNNVTNQKEVDTVLRDFEQVLSEQLSDELDRMKKEISKAQAQLQLAEEELERKFNQTMTYMNMKKMIQKKNDQVKQLRESLNKYEPSDKIEEEME
uniref:Leucine zipper transcription factor-like protein 1 n=1 Tax=Cacopsylla melanoneura TaxID=428564 RepID=A0A8D9B418_9HEMI